MRCKSGAVADQEERVEMEMRDSVLVNDSVQMERFIVFLYLKSNEMSIIKKKSLHCSNLEGRPLVTISLASI